VAAEREVFEASSRFLRQSRANGLQWGPSGSGVAMKLVVNTLLGLGMQSIAEAVARARTRFASRPAFLDTLGKTAVVAPAHAGKLASASGRLRRRNFPIRLMNKDFGLILAARGAVWASQCPLTEGGSGC